MRQTGIYSIDCDYDLDHEINKQCDIIENVLDGIDSDGKPENKKAILEAMQETFNKIIDKELCS